VGTGFRAENRFFSKDENFKKSPHLFTLIFLPSWWCTAMQSNANSLPIIYNFCYATACKRNVF